MNQTILLLFPSPLNLPSLLSLREVMCYQGKPEERLTEQEVR